MKRYSLFLGLLAAMLVAGCVSPPQPDTPSPTNSTSTDASSVVQQSSLDTTQIFAGGTTRMILTLQNPRNQPLQDVTTAVGNRGTLQFTRRVPHGNTAQEYRCHYDQVPGGEASSPVTRRCVWEIAAPNDIVGVSRDSATFPLTAYVTYRSTVTPNDALSVSFRKQQDITPRDRTERTVSAGNGDIAVTVAHASPVAAAPAEIPVTITVNNRGPGTIVSDSQDQRGVTVAFGGTLGDARWDMQESTCADGGQKQKTVTIHDTAQRTQISCTIVLAENALAGKTYSLRPSATYRYRVTHDTPITITSAE